MAIFSELLKKALLEINSSYSGLFFCVKYTSLTAGTQLVWDLAITQDWGPG